MDSGNSAYEAPCSTRASTSSGSDVVSAASSEPAVTTARMPSSTGRRPCTSPSRPRTGVSTAAASRLAVRTQPVADGDEPSASPIVASTGTTTVCRTAIDVAARARTGSSRGEAPGGHADHPRRAVHRSRQCVESRRHERRRLSWAWTTAPSRPPGARRAGDRREQAILDGARSLLEAKPLSQVTTDELAGAAGLSRSSFYFYFDSKQAVLAALLEGLSDELRGGEQPLARGGRPGRGRAAAGDARTASRCGARTAGCCARPGAATAATRQLAAWRAGLRRARHDPAHRGQDRAGPGGGPRARRPAVRGRAGPRAARAPQRPARRGPRRRRRTRRLVDDLVGHDAAPAVRAGAGPGDGCRCGRSRVVTGSTARHGTRPEVPPGSGDTRR